MNFLQLFASGASFLNFNFQNKSQSTSQIPIKNSGFQKVRQNNKEIQYIPKITSNINDEQATILTQILQNQRSGLIQRYLQLNYQLLNGKNQSCEKNELNIQNLPFNNKNQINMINKQESEQKQKNIQNSNKKKIKKQVKCGHPQKQHYAKGLCNNCYHKFGRNKKPLKCPHDKLYAAGMCQNCYINDYNRKKRQQNKINQQIDHEGKYDSDQINYHDIEEKLNIVNQNHMEKKETLNGNQVKEENYFKKYDNDNYQEKYNVITEKYNQIEMPKNQQLNQNH